MQDSVSSVWPNSQFSTVTWEEWDGLGDHEVEIDADDDQGWEGTTRMMSGKRVENKEDHVIKVTYITTSKMRPRTWVMMVTRKILASMAVARTIKSIMTTWLICTIRMTAIRMTVFTFAESNAATAFLPTPVK